MHSLPLKLSFHNGYLNFSSKGKVASFRNRHGITPAKCMSRVVFQIQFIGKTPNPEYFVLF